MGAVLDAVSGVVAGTDSVLGPVACRLAQMLDDPDCSQRDAAALSRELRQVLESFDVGESEAGALFDLEARRAARAARRA